MGNIPSTYLNNQGNIFSPNCVGFRIVILVIFPVYEVSYRKYFVLEVALAER